MKALLVVVMMFSVSDRSGGGGYCPGGTCLGDLGLNGNDILDTDWIYSDAVTTDTAPNPLVITSQPIYTGPGATNVTGAALVLTPSPSERTLEGVDYVTADTETLTFEVQSNGVVTQTIKTAGTDWVCNGAGSDTACVCNLYDHLTGAGAITGLTVVRSDGTCSDEKLTFNITPGVSEYLEVFTSDDAKLDMTIGYGDKILIAGNRYSGGPMIAFATDQGTGIGTYEDSKLYFYSNGNAAGYASTAGLYAAYGVTISASVGLQWSGSTKMDVSGGNGTLDIVTTAGQGLRIDLLTNNVASLYDEAGNDAMKLQSNTMAAQSFTHYVHGGDITIRPVNTGSALTSGGITIASANSTNVGNYPSGNVSISSGTTDTDGDSGDITLATGVSGAGSADAGDIFLKTYGTVLGFSILGATGEIDTMKMRYGDLDSTCTVNQVAIDNGGATVELCFCQATDTWYCITVDDTTGPAD